jgi:methylated-DNA-protein-cysteine methyltransferase-like protein
MPGYISPPDPNAFRQEVWALVKQIPAGQVATYGQIASLIAPPAGIDPHSYLSLGARWVGSAMATCPDDVPWQRVVNSQGKISLSNPKAVQEQRVLLEAEGILFDTHDRIDLSRYRWQSP